MLLLIIVTSCSSKTVESEKSPNIVLIVADDLGFSDLGCYGGEIITPNIDKLASKGIRFTNFYNGSRCCPSRASLLTGVYPHQAGIGHMVEDRGIPSYSGELSSETPTIAEMLKDRGYATYMAGKWHITKNTVPGTPNVNRPLNRGFDHFYGILPGYSSLWNPAFLMKDSTFITIPEESDYYFTEAIAESSCQYIQEAHDNDKPLFMYVAFTAPHYPLHARQEYIDHYTETYKQGWDKLRQQRTDNLINSGILPKGTELSPRDELSNPWEDEESKDWQASRMAAFAAMVEQVDVAVGDIIKTLEENNELDNTLIIFMSDNGGSCEGHLNNTIERWGKEWSSKHIPKFTRDGRTIKSGDWVDEPLGADTTFGSYGVKWANLSNAPFRRHKSWMHEGGISTPSIAYWPNQIKSGRIENTPSHIIDIMATAIDITSENNSKGGVDVKPEGESLLPLFQGKGLRDRTLCWEHEGNRAIQKDGWKLVSEHPGTWSAIRKYEENGSWELYKLSEDRTELTNLASKYPEKVKELSDEWQQWADRTGVIKWSSLVEGDY